MSRIPYYPPQTEAQILGYDPQPERLGWFETDTAQSWDCAWYNPIDGGRLWHTPSGRWIITRRGEYGTALATEDDARRELVAIGAHADIERLIDTPTRTPGRPEIGPEVKVRLPQSVVDTVDTMAASNGISRAEQLRRIVLDGTG